MSIESNDPYRRQLGAWLRLGAVAVFASNLCGSTPSAMAMSVDDIVVDFGSTGLWRLSAGGWSYGTDLDPQVLASWNDRAAVSFTGQGLWSYDGTDWAQLTVWEPYDAMAWNSDLVASFDSGRGLWLHSSSSWSQLTPWEPEQLIAQGDRLIASFGTSRGLWSYEFGSWMELTPWHPDDFLPWGNDLVARFDAGRGVWRHDGSTWTQITHRDAEHLAVFNDGLAVSLAPDLGLWLYHGVSFSQLTSWQPYALVGTGDALIAAFDDGRGIWEYRLATGWVQLSGWEPIHIAPADGSLVIDFGHGYGLWRHDSGGWSSLTTWNAEQLEALGPEPRGVEDPLDVGSDVPDNAYCQDVKFWNPAWRSLEEEILTIVNQRRGEGAVCGSEGSFAPTTPLSMQPELRCAARVHSKDMVDRDFFSHTNPDGELPWDRFARAGYDFSAAGENIAAGNSTATATMTQWMTSDGHCANVMNGSFEELGVGYYPGGSFRHYWTQGFGRPP